MVNGEQQQDQIKAYQNTTTTNNKWIILQKMGTNEKEIKAKREKKTQIYQIYIWKLNRPTFTHYAKIKTKWNSFCNTKWFSIYPKNVCIGAVGDFHIAFIGKRTIKMC